MVVTNGKIGLSGGTSASGPIFAGECGAEPERSRAPVDLGWITRAHVAGVVGLLNGQLLKAGKPQLGFFNPLL